MALAIDTDAAPTVAVAPGVGVDADTGVDTGSDTNTGDWHAKTEKEIEVLP